MEIIFSTGVGWGEALVHAARHRFYSVSHSSSNKTVCSHSLKTCYLTEFHAVAARTHLSRWAGHVVRSGWNRNMYEVSLRKDTTRKHIIVYWKIILKWILGNRDSSVGIATGFELADWVSIPGKGMIFIQTGSGTHPPSASWNKVARAWSWPLTFTYSRGQEWWRYTSTPPYVFLAWCIIKHRDNLTFTFILRKGDGWVWIGFIWLRMWIGAGACQHSEPSCFIKFWEFLD
jgi:hypothetical protein